MPFQLEGRVPSTPPHQELATLHHAGPDFRGVKSQSRVSGTKHLARGSQMTAQDAWALEEQEAQKGIHWS